MDPAPPDPLAELRTLVAELRQWAGVMPALLTTRQACRYLACSRKTLLGWRKTGRLPGAARRIGRVLRWKRVALDRAIERLPVAK